MKKEDFIWELWNLTRELQRSRLGLCFEFCKKYDLTNNKSGSSCKSRRMKLLP